MPSWRRSSAATSRAKSWLRYVMVHGGVGNCHFLLRIRNASKAGGGARVGVATEGTDRVFSQWMSDTTFRSTLSEGHYWVIIFY